MRTVPKPVVQGCNASCAHPMMVELGFPHRRLPGMPSRPMRHSEGGIALIYDTIQSYLCLLDTPTH